MRKTTSSESSSTVKDVESYLAAVPEPHLGALLRIRKAIRAVVPAETTECISYGMPMFKYKGQLVAYAAFANHCSFFPCGSSALQPFQDELKDFRTSKGTIHFTVDKPLPIPLVKKIVKARVAQNELKKTSKSASRAS